MAGTLQDVEVWANYSDRTAGWSPYLKWWFSKGNPPKSHNIIQVDVGNAVIWLDHVPSSLSQ